MSMKNFSDTIGNRDTTIVCRGCILYVDILFIYTNLDSTYQESERFVVNGLFESKEKRF
jgi:hypothetical protein